MSGLGAVHARQLLKEARRDPEPDYGLLLQSMAVALVSIAEDVARGRA